MVVGDEVEQVYVGRHDGRFAVPTLHQAGVTPLATQTCARVSTASTTRAIASSIGTPLSWRPSR